jgi:hypothetical protein
MAARRLDQLLASTGRRRGAAAILGAAVIFQPLACRPGPPREPLKDNDPVFVIPAIKATAEDSRRNEIPRLIELLDHEDSAVRLASFQALRDMTGQTFDYEYWRAAEGRQESITKWRAWAVEQGYQLGPK